MVLSVLSRVSFVQTREVQMVIDHCSSAPVNETINWSTEDRSKCAFKTTAPGDRFLLSVSSAVQLGGRISLTSSYPSGLSKSGFQGCIKNFFHNGEVRFYTQYQITIKWNLSESKILLSFFLTWFDYTSVKFFVKIAWLNNIKKIDCVFIYCFRMSAHIVTKYCVFCIFNS